MERQIAEWPALQTSETAGEYTETSKRWLRDRRHADMELMRAGKPIQGPAWVRLSQTTVRYRKCDLDDWIAKLSRGEAA